MDQSDILIINLSDDEDLRNYFEQKEAGEDCSMTVNATLLGVEEGNARLSINAVDIGEYKVEEEEETESDSEPTGVEIVLGEK
jgi:hypothetical protein